MRVPLTFDETRNRLIELVRAHAPVRRRWLARQFSSTHKTVFNDALGRLFFDGIVSKVGIGRRGSPEAITKGRDYRDDLRY